MDHEGGVNEEEKAQKNEKKKRGEGKKGLW